jgi:hypothetical protein
MMKYILRITLLILLVAGCTGRERLNPLDPKNPRTGGRLNGLTISSEFDTVYLSWQPISVDDLNGYHVYRQTDGMGNFERTRSVSEDTMGIVDTGLEYGREYSYFVTAYSPSFESTPSETLGISPGPAHYWITDVDDRRIYAVSHDGKHLHDIISVDGFPWNVIVTPDRAVWYGDRLYGRIIQIFGDQRFRYSPQTGWWDPVDMSYDNERKIMWIADKRGTVVKIVTPEPAVIEEIQLDGLSEPTSVSANSWQGTCWIADPDARTVFEISYFDNQVIHSVVNMIRPTHVAVNGKDNVCWVADSARIVKIQAAGVLLEIRNNFQNLYLVDVDERTDDVWAADYDASNAEARIIRFDENGNKLLEISGFSYPESIAVNPVDHSCVVTDVVTGTLTRISKRGEILSELSGFYYLHGLFIEIR